MTLQLQILLGVGAYLLGAVPFGLLLAKYGAGVDVRVAGSGNIGATNVARSAGKGWGLATLFFDALKGWAPPFVASFLKAPLPVVVACGLLAVLGHVFPVYLGFRGGKGVATALGVFVALTWKATLVAAAVFALFYAWRRVVSLGSLAGSVALFAATFFVDGLALIFARHASNIRRLARGEEKKL